MDELTLIRACWSGKGKAGCCTFAEEWVSVNRSGKPFSRVDVDMALEQTINAEAKSRLKGIIQFADVSSAVNRWMVTSNMRMEIQNRLREIVGMSTTYQETKKLHIQEERGAKKTYWSWKKP